MLIVFGCCSAFAQDIKRYSPKSLPETPAVAHPVAPEPPDSANDPTPLLAELKAIVFVPSQKAVKPAGLENVRGIHREDLEVPAPVQFDQLAAAYLGKPVSMASVNQLSRDLVLFWRAHDRPVVDVVVPEQDITSGVLQLIVTESRVGKVRVEGARWFAPHKLARKIRAKPGERMFASVLNADLDWLNTNPFRRVNLIYTPGAEVGTTDLVLKAEDRLPVRVYVGYEDSGGAPTPNETWMRDRWMAGFNWGDAFGTDQLLSYQFTTGDDLKNVLAHSANYSVPLPWRHTINFSASRSTSETELGLQTISGESWGASFRYAIPLPRTVRFSETFSLGFDFSRSNSDLDFGGLTQYNKPIELRQFAAEYQAALRDPFGATSLNLSGVYSPGQWGAANSDDRLNSTQSNGTSTTGRSGADSNFWYGRVSMERLTQLPWDWSLATRASAQAASGPLLMGGQLYLGGWDTVRGYEPGDAHGDQGALVSVELHTPPISFGQFLGWKSARDQVQFLGFWDYGTVRTLHPLPGEDINAERSSAGVGVRVNVAQYLALRFDYAWQLTDPGVIKTASSVYSSRAHVALTLSY